jgi:hypothetical protein
MYSLNVSNVCNVTKHHSMVDYFDEIIQNISVNNQRLDLGNLPDFYENY